MNAKEAREKLQAKLKAEREEYEKQLHEWVDVGEEEKKIDRLVEYAIERGQDWTYFEMKDASDAAVDKIRLYCLSQGYTVSDVLGGAWDKQRYKLRICIEF